VRMLLNLDPSVTRTGHAGTRRMWCSAGATIQMAGSSRRDRGERQHYRDHRAQNQRSKNRSYRKELNEMANSLTHFAGSFS
jgi:hypothetical protein